MNRLLWPGTVPITFVFLLAGMDGAAAANVGVERADGKIVVTVGDQPFTEYLYSHRPKPVLYPILGPHGLQMTRSWPLAEAPGEAKDHPHHESLWYTHGEVNGIDFWASHGTDLPRIEHAELITAEGGETGTIAARNRWLGPDGKPVCTDTTTLHFGAIDEHRFIDFQIELHASEGELTFGDTKEGTFALRVHPNLQPENNPKAGVTTAEGEIVNSEDQRNAEVWGKHAKWVDYSGTIEGHEVGIAIFDHPQNPRHPTTWHARTYGLFAANPFGIAAFENKPAGTGAMKLAPGESVKFRYRVLLHDGGPAEAKINQRFEEFAEEEFDGSR